MFSISWVSRETGIPMTTLRKWEERYGFPKPKRHNGYTRSYSYAEIEQLHEIKRLIDQGARPSEVLDDKFLVLANLKLPVKKNPQNEFIHKALDMLVAHEMKMLRGILEKKLKKIGVFEFIVQVAEPLTIIVGEKWADGTLDVFTEHSYSEQMSSLLNSTAKPKIDSENDSVAIFCERFLWHPSQ